MLNSIALITCDHGLGHVRRAILTAQKFSQKSKKITLFCPEKSALKLSKYIDFPDNLVINDFSTNTSPFLFAQPLSTVTNWLEKLPSLDSYDSIVSDNLPEILSIRPDAILQAQFFWHKVLPDMDKDYYFFCEDLIERYSPTTLGCALFSMEYIKNMVNYVPMPIYKLPQLTSYASNLEIPRKSNLLISAGSTFAAIQVFQELVNTYISEKNNSYHTIYIDRNLLPRTYPDWIKPADYSQSMFLSLKSAICRPGLGIISDLITFGIIPKPLYESGNQEMIHNAKVLGKLTTLFSENDIPLLF